MFGQYYEATEPGRRERAYAWSTAIGLQNVDGLKTSQYLIDTAKRHIEGEITQDEARRLVDAYYETKSANAIPADTQQADKVSARIVAVINSPTFNFSVPYYLGLHRQIFEGVFPFAGQIRSVELTKREWVLNGASVQYTPATLVEDTLAYDFAQECKVKYSTFSNDAFIEHFAAFIANIWQIHPFREGNTRTTALFAIKYLRAKGYDVTNDLFAAKSYFFRNALVRANYENTQLGVDKTLIPLVNFFKVLIYNHPIELKSRHLFIGTEFAPNEVNHEVNEVNQRILQILKANPRCTIPALATSCGVSRATIDRAIKILKDANLLRRIGSTRGHWQVV